MKVNSIVFSTVLSIMPSRKTALMMFIALMSQFHLPAFAADENVERGEFIGSVATEYPDWFKISFLELEEDVAEAAAEGKRLMLVFHQDGCPYCNVFIERNLAQVDIEQTLKTKFDVIELNMWGDREVVSVAGETYTEKQFAVALNVQFTPTVLFLNEQGRLALRLNGLYGPDRFRIALDYVTNKMENQMSFSDYLESNGVVESSKKLIQRSYYTAPIEHLSEHAAAAEKPMLILFEQGDCRNCEVLHDSILSKDSSQALLDQFNVFQVDMWGRDVFETPSGQKTSGRQWSKELGVSYAPTMILFAADGTEVIRSESFFRTFHTQSILDYVASDEWRNEASFQRYLSARADSQQERGETVNIWDTN